MLIRVKLRGLVSRISLIFISRGIVFDGVGWGGR